MRPFLMGVESECSLTGTRHGSPLPRSRIQAALCRELGRQHRWLPDGTKSGGMFLESGHRYYLDTGQHNEICTPETTTPQELAIYEKASESILYSACAALNRRHGDLKLRVIKSNLSFVAPGAATWGSHEAFTCWRPADQIAPQLLAHLVSRSPYAGSGCLSERAGGFGYELSQRARHLVRAVGPETTADRAIFCTRANKHTDRGAAGWWRTNLLTQDHRRSPFAIYLNAGVTGLLFVLLNDGHDVGRGLDLVDPVAAMQRISLDPRLQARVPLCDGRQLTAIEIQRVYLERADRRVQGGDYPPWVQDVLRDWSQTLDDLETDPLRTANRLDAYLKLLILEHALDRAGMSWPQLRETLEQLLGARGASPPPAETCESPLAALRAARAESRGGSEGRRHFVTRLQALETSYHELGGLFDELAASGSVDCRAAPAEMVERATHAPPPASRAAARSRAIREFSGDPDCLCTWDRVHHRSRGIWIDMPDPFSPHAQRRESPPERRSEPA